MEILYLLPGAFFAPVIHEWAKAVASHLQGDPTPRNKGFLTANPLKFIEPIGFMMMLIFNGFGWGQPVPTASLHYKNRRRGVLVTHITPIAVNFTLGVVSIIILSLLDNGPINPLMWVLFYFAQCNIFLALFNLIPVHPLAMHKIIQPFLRPDTLVKLNHYEKPMQIILILTLVFQLVHAVFNPVWEFVLRTAWLT
ncbi:MAG: site-2 protease family protein [Defluviitaleaceae bacterium]|nr:site-2 protease family protein [Defluviitaleaceae bacterium]